jgi:hypothetical protein
MHDCHAIALAIHALWIQYMFLSDKPDAQLSPLPLLLTTLGIQLSVSDRSTPCTTQHEETYSIVTINCGQKYLELLCHTKDGFKQHATGL